MIPLLIDLHDRNTLIIGGGKIATRKALRLYEETELTVIAPELSPELTELARAGKIKALLRAYQPGDTDEADFIYICSSDARVNAAVAAAVRADQWLNDSTDKANSNFYSMAEIQTDNRLIALSSFGEEPAQTRKLKGELEKFLDEKKED